MRIFQMFDFDAKEKQMDKSILDQFDSYKTKETCPMCRAVKHFEKKLGKKVAEEMFLSIYEEREHDQRMCFLDSYVFCKAQEIMWYPVKQINDMANEQYDSVVNFVNSKKVNK